MWFEGKLAVIDQSNYLSVDRESVNIEGMGLLEVELQGARIGLFYNMQEAFICIGSQARSDIWSKIYERI